MGNPTNFAPGGPDVSSQKTVTDGGKTMRKGMAYNRLALGLQPV